MIARVARPVVRALRDFVREGVRKPIFMVGRLVGGVDGITTAMPRQDLAPPPAGPSGSRVELLDRVQEPLQRVEERLLRGGWLEDLRFDGRATAESVRAELHARDEVQALPELVEERFIGDCLLYTSPSPRD